jgi:Ser/Thr protein kinase RdoA (MazF antagonist)
MSSASVVHTTLSASAVAEFVSSVYDLPGQPSARLVNRGFNDIYEIATSPPLFLRIARQARRSVADAEAEGCALAEAQAAGVPVAVAVRGRDGRFGQRLAAPEGDRAVLLFVVAPGADAEATPAHAWAQGRSLAQLHEVRLSEATRAALRRVDLATMVEQTTARAVALWRDRPALVAGLERVAAGISRRIVEIGPSVGLCHGDCHGFNARIDGDVATLFDFDDGGVGWLAYDLATYLRNCEIAFSSSCRELWTAFMGGYRSVRTLPAVDREVLEAMVLVRELWTFGAWAEGAEHWGDKWFNSVWAERRLKSLEERFDRMVGPRLA